MACSCKKNGVTYDVRNSSGAIVASGVKSEVSAYQQAAAVGGSVTQHK